MRVPCCLLMLILMFGLSHLLLISAQSNATALDNALQNYAFKAFKSPRTGVPYEASVPANLTGVKITALRLKSGSLYKRGRLYEEFDIPTGVIVSPYVERLVFVYQNLGNWSQFYYPLKGYKYLSPVLGLLAYDAQNLSAQNLPELDVRPSANPILIDFKNVVSTRDGYVLKCLWFDLQGDVHFSNVTFSNVCSTSNQGHFAIVTEAVAPGGTKIDSKIWIIIGSAVGGFVLLVLSGLVVLLILKIMHRRKMQRMEKASDVGEAFETVYVGSTRAPFAPRIRTAPMIETEYVLTCSPTVEDGEFTVVKLNVSFNKCKESFRVQPEAVPAGCDNILKLLNTSFLINVV